MVGIEVIQCLGGFSALKQPLVSSKGSQKSGGKIVKVDEGIWVQMWKGQRSRKEIDSP